MNANVITSLEFLDAMNVSLHFWGIAWCLEESNHTSLTKPLQSVDRTTMPAIPVPGLTPVTLNSASG